MKAARLTAPTAIGVSDLEGIMERFLAARGNRDAAAILQPLKQAVTWKNSPNARALVDYSDL